MTKSIFHSNILTLFPEMFPGPLRYSLAGKALLNNIWSFSTTNIRDFAIDRYGTVDDIPFGGGAGMVLRPDVIEAALDSISDSVQRGLLIYFTPRGQKLSQELVRKISQEPSITLLCGRYEGIDERLFKKFNFFEISLGDFILSGGEIAAITLLDACIRLLPGVVSKEESLLDESFETGLLEYPLYTKPASWKGFDVPDILRSGHHQEILKWRQEQAIYITKKRRPDLWVQYLKKKFKENK